MKIAIMQPYIFPYIGYFQLMNAVDEFVVYDNIEFTKKGWINRNRILVNGHDDYISLPLKKDSDYLEIKARYLADIWPVERIKILNRIKESYRKAAYFNDVFPLIERILKYSDDNLFSFVLNSLTLISEYIAIKTPIIISSSISVDHTLKSDKRVIAICKSQNATEYINPIGGMELYSKADFLKHDIILYFLKTENFTYPQFENNFIPFLSIIDILMFNSKEEITNLLNAYTLI